MKKKLYIHKDRASQDGHEDLPTVTYIGAKPSRVICVQTETGMCYFVDDREAHRVMQKETVLELRMLPVID